MDLKRVSKIRQKYKDVVNGYAKEVETSFPDNNAYFTIVELIRHIILLYYHHSFESKILSEDDQEKFIALLIKNSKDIVDSSWKLIFDSSKDGLTSAAFVDKVYDHSNVLMFIQAKDQCIIGGYTKTGWDKKTLKVAKARNSEMWTADKDAFIFYLKAPNSYYDAPFISNIKQNGRHYKRALGYSPGYYESGYYATFGYTWPFCMLEGRFQSRQNDHSNNYEEFPNGKKQLTGSDSGYYNITNVVIEVFQIDD